MTTLLIIWGIVCIALMLVGSQQRHGSAGLPLAYLFELSLIHVPGALVYDGAEDWRGMTYLTRLGFEQTVIGMVAFLAGVMIARYSAFAFRSEERSGAPHAIDFAALDRLSLLYMGLGFASFMSMQLLSSIPSSGAMGSALASLMIVGACLRLWVMRESGNRTRWWQTIALLPLLPLLTLLKDGFLSFGTHWLLSILGFLFNQSKQARIGYIVIAPIVAFVGLSAFVNYMASRTEYRKMVWYEQADLGDRIQRVAEMFEKFEWLDLSSERQREAIDERLNQNVLVGLAKERLSRGQVDYASGESVGIMIMALIPRAIWPEKPTVGGGADVVQRYTGVKFTEGTSVGAGQVLEFYVNFGTWGIVGGFLLWGWLLGRMDVSAIDCLNRGDQAGFLLWFLTSIAMVQPGGNLLEIVVSAASAAVASKAISYALNRRFAALMAGGHIQSATSRHR